MADDKLSPDDQSAIDQMTRGALQQLAAGRSADEVSRDLQTGGLAKSTADGLAEHLQQQWQQIAANPRANASAYFAIKYPEMRPARSGPSLFTMHGIGTLFLGQRDRDAPTGTYVKTQCFCFFYFPLFALASYRVAPNGNGWTLVGRVPLSRFARWWNLLLPMAIAAFVGLGLWDEHEKSLSVVAARTILRADDAATAGKLVEASRLYAEVARGRTEHATDAADKCIKLADRPEIDSMPLTDAIQLFGNAAECASGRGQSQHVFDRGLSVVKKGAAADPSHATQLLGRLAIHSRDKACAAFAELMEGPFAQLAPADAVLVVREASPIPQDAAQKTAFIALVRKQCLRIAPADLPAAFDMLAVLATTNEQGAIDDGLAALLAAPLEQAPCNAVAKSLAIAKGFAGPTNEKKLFDAGIAWVDHHRSADPKELLALLDQLAALDDADPAQVAAARRPLLEKLVAANPQDVDLVVQLAVAIEADASNSKRPDDTERNPTAKIIKLLSPIREKLGAGEGARALGQALAAEGKYDESYALLEPYLAQRLDAFHAAEEAYTDAIKNFDTRIGEQLRQGTAPGFNYDRVNRVSDKEAQAMAAEYAARQMKDDPGVNAAREALARQGMVVPAALDLGMVMLQRAQAMKDPALRRTELERAEKTFQSIRGTAGEADQYLLRLGQVYYWLGKQQEGQQEFDKLLAKHERKPEILYALANALRELGATPDARKLMEEAYDKSSETKMRYAVAHLRAITSKNLDDEILWLERCDADNSHVKALLAESRGHRAETQGQYDEAADQYRAAVAVYEKLPVSSDVLNNGALAYVELFEVSGDRQAFERATQWFDKAVSLSPADSLVVSNAANQMLRAAVQDLAGARLNLRELQMSGEISALYYLAANQHDLDELRRRAREHAGLRKALNYIERALVLAPKNQGDTRMAAEVYSFMRDSEALKRLAARVQAARPDTQEVTAETLDFYHFRDTATMKTTIQSGLTRSQALVSRLAAGEKGPAFAVAADKLIDMKLMLPVDQADSDEMLRLAEEARRTAPSMATYGPCIRALMRRAGVKLAADFPEYAQATRETSRAVSDSYTVALAMERSDALGNAARENPDVQRAVALVAERAEAFPDSRDAWDWSVLAAAGPGRAELRGKCLADDDVRQSMYEIMTILLPTNSHEAFDSYFRRRAAGKANARAALDELVKLGVPLPLALIQ